MNINKKTILGILIITLFFTTAINAQTLHQKLNKVESNIHRLNKAIKQKKAEKSIAVSDLKHQDDILESAQSKIAKSQLKIAAAKSELDIIESQLKITENNLARRNNLLRGRIVDIYQGGDLDYINVFLNTTDMWTFVTQSYYIKKMIEYDTSLIKEINNDKKKILKGKKKKEDIIAGIKQQQKSLIIQRNEEARLSKAKRSRILAIENNKDKLEIALNMLERSSKDLEKRILAQQRTKKGRIRYAKAFTGNLSLPVGGRISSRFGNRFHPIRHRTAFHAGVDIAAPTGTPIHASGSGVVIVSGNISGYGKTIVIDHGGGVSTLYGHCSALLARRGASVSKGQVIARVGSTGYSTGPHCHYEKRVNGRPVNPL